MVKKKKTDNDLSDKVKQQIDVFRVLHYVNDIGIFARLMLSTVGYPIVRAEYERAPDKKQYIENMYSYYKAEKWKTLS